MSIFIPVREKYDTWDSLEKNEGLQRHAHTHTHTNCCSLDPHSHWLHDCLHDFRGHHIYFLETHSTLPSPLLASWSIYIKHVANISKITDRVDAKTPIDVNFTLLTPGNTHSTNNKFIKCPWLCLLKFKYFILSELSEWHKMLCLSLKFQLYEVSYASRPWEWNSLERNLAWRAASASLDFHHPDADPGGDCEISQARCASRWSMHDGDGFSGISRYRYSADVITSVSSPPILFSGREQANIGGFCLVFLALLNTNNPAAKTALRLLWKLHNPLLLPLVKPNLILPLNHVFTLDFYHFAFGDLLFVPIRKTNPYNVTKLTYLGPRQHNTHK